MSFDWNAFVKTPDPQLIGNLAGATRERLRALRSVLPEAYPGRMITQFYIVNSFTKNLEPPDHKHWLENTTIRLIEGFAHWYLSEHEINHQSGLHTFIQFFRMYWRK